MTKSKKSSGEKPEEPIGICEECGHEFFEKNLINGKLPKKCPGQKCHNDDITDLRSVDIEPKNSITDDDDDLDDGFLGTDEDDLI